MKSMHELFDEYLAEKNIWDYYEDSWNDIPNIVDLIEKGEDFIKSILKNGKKLNSMTDKHISELSKTLRVSHTVAIYFFGLLIYNGIEAIKSSINNFINIKNVELEVDKEFSYYWFLICFFHDIGYLFEGKEGKDALGEILVYQNGKVSLSLPMRPKGIPRIISKNINKYLKYRFIEHRCIDHGIIGGRFFYDERESDYFRRRANHKNDYFVEDNRFWSKSILENIHLPVAWTIAAHNVWLCYKPEDEELYKKHNLDELIIKQPIVSLKNHSLLYLLSVVDTIDPVKFLLRNCEEMSIKEILESVKVKLIHNQLVLKIDNVNENLEITYYNNLCEMSNWIQCNTTVSNRRFYIEFL